jgi:hypothetical protein
MTSIFVIRSRVDPKELYFGVTESCKISFRMNFRRNGSTVTSASDRLTLGHADISYSSCSLDSQHSPPCYIFL